MSSVRILIADDHDVVRRGLAMVLNLETDFEVVGEAQDSAGVLSLVESAQPHVVILDMKMPGMSGQEVARQLKQCHPEIKVMILSGAEIDDDVFDTLDLGIDGYVLKDVSPAELNRAIRMVMNGQVYIHADVTQALLNRWKQKQPPASLSQLTPREMDVLQLLATSATYLEIGKQLSIGEETVRSHVKAILAKLEQPNRTMAVVTAVKMGLIQLD